MTEAFSLLKGHECFGRMMVGYPKFRYHRLPIRKPGPITWHCQDRLKCKGYKHSIPIKKSKESDPRGAGFELTPGRG